MDEFVFENVERKIGDIVHGSTADLSRIDFLDPWTIAIISSFLVERHNNPDKQLILPKSDDLISYLCRLHFHDFLEALGYIQASQVLQVFCKEEKESFNVHEMLHCRTKDELEGRLHRFIKIFENFGLDPNGARIMTAIVGELGNNVFDHNLGSWPTDILGCIILAQRNEKLNRIQIVIADFGAGFLASLQPAYPEIENDIEAIRKGLAGFTGRLREQRGNGLKTVRGWTIDRFHGKLSIQSGSGLANVSASGIETKTMQRILGTIVQLMIEY